MASKKYRLPPNAPREWANDCYLCGTKLTPTSRSKEHIVPQWLQRRFDLREATITIDGGLAVPYRHYVVPCCIACNCELLAPIEKLVQEAFDDRDEGPSRVPREMLSLWCCKMVAAALKYSMHLGTKLVIADDRIADTRAVSRDTDEKDIARTQIMALFLRMLHGTIEVDFVPLFGVIPLHGIEFPFSSQIFRTKEPHNRARSFYFHLDCELAAIYVRCGPWTLLMCLDGGHISCHAKNWFDQYRLFELAPLQADEVAANFFTMASTSAKTWYRLVDGSRGRDRLEADIRPNPYPFDEEVRRNVYPHWLRKFTGQPDIAWTDSGIVTWLDISPEGVLFEVDADSSASADWMRRLVASSETTGVSVDFFKAPAS